MTGCADGGRGTAAAPTSPATSAAPTTSATGAAATGQFEPARIAWHTCGEHLECGMVAVPLDYRAPAGATITLALARIPARSLDHRIGSLLVNPGGPGVSGVDFVSFGEMFGADVHDRFDVVGFDPRGVGDSTGLTCGGALVDRFMQLDSDPDDSAEQATLERAAQSIADDCAAKDGALLPHIGTIDVVRDIDAIRRALGDEPITYVGFSYGTLLGQRYAQAFGSGARAMVLDALVDPSEGFRESLRARTAAFEGTIAQMLQACESLASACPSEGAEAAYDRILAEVETIPLPAGGEVLGPGDLATAAIYVTDSPMLWRSFYQALAEALDGDGSALRDLANSYRSFGGFTAYLAVNCRDSPHPVGAADYAAFAAELEAISPRFGAAVANELLPCAFWPTPPGGEPAAVIAPDAPPILVIGNTGDAATAVEQARRVADSLNAVLLTYEGDGHTSFGSSSCVNEAVTRYLIELRLPNEGTVCR